VPTNESSSKKNCRREADVLDVLAGIEREVRILVSVLEARECASQRLESGTRREKQLLQDLVVPAVDELEEHSRNRRLVSELGHDVPLERLGQSVLRSTGLLDAPLVVGPVGVEHRTVEQLGEPVRVDELLPRLVFRRSVHGAQPVGDLADQKAAGSRPENEVRESADPDPACFQHVVDVERQLRVPAIHPDEVEELGLDVQDAAGVDACLDPSGAPTEERLVDAEELAGIRQDRRVVGQIGQSFVRGHVPVPRRRASVFGDRAAVGADQNVCRE
jgi:hypothetical protein